MSLGFNLSKIMHLGLRQSTQHAEFLYLMQSFYEDECNRPWWPLPFSFREGPSKSCRTVCPPIFAAQQAYGAELVGWDMP